MSNATHNCQILMALKAGATLSSLDGLNRFGTMRMVARIADLRRGDYDGVRYDIETVWEKNAEGKGRHALYQLRRYAAPFSKPYMSFPVPQRVDESPQPKAENQPSLFP